MLMIFLGVTYLLCFRSFNKVNIVNGRNAILFQQLNAGFNLLKNLIRHQCIDCPSVDKVTIDSFLLNDFLNSGEVLGLKFGYLSCCLDAMSGNKAGRSAVRIRLEMTAYFAALVE